jgi:hypothetical protein
LRIPKTLIWGSIGLFGVIGFLGLTKGKKEDKIPQIVQNDTVQEIVISTERTKEKEVTKVAEVVPAEDALPDADCIDRLFTLGSNKMPIVETISYTSRVPWLKGRPAWIADYASFYQTSRHFIARSLNKKKDYFSQNVNLGDKFNVFKKDKDLSFYLLIDMSRAKMWFYALDNQQNERCLLKTYRVGLGRKDPKSPSGFLTPLGKFALGSKIAIYKPGTMGYFQDRKIEMIRVFGTRWIPFDEALQDSIDEAKGFGIHGAPWVTDASGQLSEDASKIGKYESDGCIRLLSDDIEELFSIIITKPTVVELVKDFHDAQLPGKETQWVNQ